MDTGRMLHLEGLSPGKISELFTESCLLKEITITFYEAFEKAQLRSQITELVKEHYDLGKVVDVYEIFGGYVNRSFGIYVEKDGRRAEYFVRKYKQGITDQEISFEHSLIDYSIANGLDLAAGLVQTKQNTTFVKIKAGEEVVHFAIYQYLAGEDKYTWDNPNLNEEEYASAAEVLAMFHNAARNFDPRGLERVEPKIMEFLPTLPAVYKEFAGQFCNTKFHKCYLKNLDSILRVINSSQIPDTVCQQMLFVPCHNDFHPGNLKFSNDRAIGLFDFDWSKIELRLFDVCLALAYCCSSWEDELDGTLLLDKCRIFLNAYQKKLRELGGIPPLNELEKEYLATMMAAANMYLINWDVTAYYGGSNLNEYEYIAYLQHNVRLMKWIENHKQEIADMAKEI